MQSSMSGSTPNLADGVTRSFASSFSAQPGATSPGFHRTGLHNFHGNFNFPSMSGTLGSRNSSMSNIPSIGVQQPSGSHSNGHFSSNMSHGSSHGHSGMTNRGGMNMVGSPGYSSNTNGVGSIPGILPTSAALSNQNTVPGLGVSPMLGNVGPQITGSMGNIVGGGNLGRSMGSSGGLSVTGLASRINLSGNAGSGNLHVQGPNRLMSCMLQQGSLRKQGLGVSPIVQQNQEFSIQNEDFPALPGFKGGNAEYAVDLHQKEQLQDNVSMMQSQHFPMGRSGGFNLGGGASSSHRPQQQQHAPSVSSSGLSFSGVNNQDLLHLHGSDMFPLSHSSYHSQTNVPPGLELRPLNSPNTVSGMGLYDQIMKQYQQHQNQNQFRLQQMSGVNQLFRDQKSMQASQIPLDPYGLLGLLSIVRMSDPVLSSLALGIDLTMLGLNLNAIENLYKTFGTPWTDEPAKGDPEFTVPQCYYAKQPPSLNQYHFAKFPVDVLFYVFYSMPKDEAQLCATNELYNRGWFYHKEHRLWFVRVPNVELLVKTNTYERGSSVSFDPNTWETIHRV